MAGLVLTIPGLGSGSAASDAGIGFVGDLTIPHSPMAFYLLGTRFGSGVRDLSGNGHTARKIGAPARGEMYAIGTSNSHRFQTPITGDQAAAFGEMCLVAIARAPQASEVVSIGNYVDGSTRSSSVGMPSAHLVRGYTMALTQNDEIASDAARGDRWTFMAANVTTTSIQVFERHWGSALQAGPTDTFAEQDIGGEEFICLGGCPSVTTFLSTQDIIGGGLYQETLTTDQIDEIYEYHSALFTSQGEVV